MTLLYVLVYIYSCNYVLNVQMEDSDYINKQKMMFNINNSNYILFTRQNWIRILINYHQSAGDHAS